MTEKEKAMYRDLWHIYEPFRFKIFTSDSDIEKLGKAVNNYFKKNVRNNDK